jgi:hypothetical protein
VLSADELRGELHNPELASSLWTARGRAEKYMEAQWNPSGPLPTVGPNAGLVLTGPTGDLTPAAGYAWAMRGLSFQLAVAAIANVFKTADPVGTNPGNWPKIYGRDTSNQIHTFQWSSVQFVLKSGEYAALSLQSAQALSTPVALVFMEVPEAELWKVE